MRTRQHETTEMLEQKKTNSKTPLGPTKDTVNLKDMSNSVDPDETAQNEPSHQDLCCLQKPIFTAYGSERVNIWIRHVNRQ